MTSAFWCQELADDAAMHTVDRESRLSPLGTQRLRLLECLGGNDRWAQGYFEPDVGSDILEEFRRYALRLSDAWASASDRVTVSLLAAARFLSGDPSAAQLIVDHLPAQPIKLDHGAGICLVLPLHVLSAALPLPATLHDTRRWLAGSPEQRALCAWLAEHRGRLRWSEADGRYEVSDGA